MHGIVRRDAEEVLVGRAVVDRAQADPFFSTASPLSSRSPRLRARDGGARRGLRRDARLRRLRRARHRSDHPLRQTTAVKRGEHGAPPASTGAGRSREPTSSGTRASGAARLARASRSRSGQGRPPLPARPARLPALARPPSAPCSVEREFRRLKHEYGLTPLRVRGFARVELHADVTMLLGSASRLRGLFCSRRQALAQMRTGPASLNPVRLGSYVSRASGASGDCELSAGVLAAGPVEITLADLGRERR